MKQSRLLTTLKKQLFKYIVGSGENVGNLFPHNVFYSVEDKLKHWKKIYLVVCKIKCFLFGDAQNFIIGKELTLYRTIPTLMTLRKKPFENIMGKGENAFPTVFSTLPLILSQTTNFGLSQTERVCR